jgi:CheY-like chemotaxis protein
LLSGSIAVENIKNMGSVFRVQIPFQLPNDQVDENLTHDQRNTVIPEMWTKLNFLMIENNVNNILIAKDLFKSWNLKLDIFDTLRNAEKALDNKYDCILFDTFLPDGNGLDFIIELRKNPVSKNYKTPVVLMTVGLNEVEVSQAKDANIESYLSKPFPPYFLIKEFHKILGIHTIPNKLENKLHSKKTNLSKKVSSEGLGNSFLETLSKRLKGRTTLMAEMAKIFLDQATVMRSILENAHEKGDYESIRFEAHKFKSTVNIIGLDALKVLASKTEEIYYDGKPEECTASLLNNFVKQIDKDTLKVKMSMKEIFQENADKLKVNSN